MKFKVLQKENPNDHTAPKKWYAVAVSAEKVSTEEIAAEIVGRSALTRGDVESALDNLGDVVPESLARGSSVHLKGIGTFRVTLGSDGVVNPDDFSRSHIHKIKVVYTPDSKMMKTLNEMHLEDDGERGGATTTITWLVDVASGSANARLTKGGGVNLSGNHLKILGTAAGVGIKLTNQTSNAVVTIPATAILVNKSNAITFIVPATLPNANYKLSLTTQFGGSSKPLKTAHTVVYDAVLVAS